MGEIGQNVGFIFFSDPVAYALRNGIFAIAGRAVKQTKMTAEIIPFGFFL